MRMRHRVAAVLMAGVLATLAAGSTALAQEPSDIDLDSRVRALELGVGEDKADIDVILINNADSRRLVNLKIEGAPESWDVAVWNTFFDYRIGEIVTEPFDPEATPHRLRLRVSLPEEAPAVGSYAFTLVLTDAGDSSVEYDRATYTIGVPEAEVEEVGEISVSTDFPVLRGPATSRYEFEVVVRNDTGEERAFDLGADVVLNDQVQQGWQVSFTPAFGEEKLISSVTIRDGFDERVNVQIRPPFFALPGDYIIPVSVQGDEFSGGTALVLSVTGQGELRATTPTGQLSFDAPAGDETVVTLQMENFGTGEVLDIGLSADTPNNWELSFQIDNIGSLPANNIIPIQVTVKPADDAIPGDYLLTLRGRSRDGSASASVDLRVTVEQSTIWGWLGIVLVIVVLGSLGGLFWRLGRR